MRPITVMTKALTHFMDFLFPPSVEAMKLRSLVIDDLLLLPSPAPVPFPFITSLFSYKNPLMTELVWSIKYKKDQHSIELASQALYNKLLTFDQNLILVPTPISKERRRERGYNQCELLVGEIINLDLKMNEKNKFTKRFDILIRRKHTSRQTLKNRKDRIKNSENIFQAINFADLIEKEIVIIDDVTTTGSTLKEARDALLAAGYKNVRALTLAH